MTPGLSVDTEAELRTLMPSYSDELEKILSQQQSQLNRKLFPEETTAACVGLVEAWFDNGRVDALIRYLLKEFSREGGLQEISTLARLLAKANDVEHLEVLFDGLISRRVKAHREWLTGSQSRTIGGMRSAARAMAEAADIFSEYYVWLEKLELKAQADLVREQMQHLLTAGAGQRTRTQAKTQKTGA